MPSKIIGTVTMRTNNQLSKLFVSQMNETADVAPPEINQYPPTFLLNIEVVVAGRVDIGPAIMHTHDKRGSLFLNTNIDMNP